VCSYFRKNLSWGRKKKSQFWKISIWKRNKKRQKLRMGDFFFGGSGNDASNLDHPWRKESDPLPVGGGKLTLVLYTFTVTGTFSFFLDLPEQKKNLTVADIFAVFYLYPASFLFCFVFLGFCHPKSRFFFSQNFRESKKKTSSSEIFNQFLCTKNRFKIFFNGIKKKNLPTEIFFEPSQNFFCSYPNFF